MMQEAGREARGEQPGAVLPKLGERKVRGTIARSILLSRDQDLAAAESTRPALQQTGG